MAQFKVMTESETFAAILARGATRAIVTFSGGNDEGGADEIVLAKPDPDNADRHVKVAELEPYHYGVDGETGTVDPLTEYLADLPSSQYGSFAGEFYVDGRITVDAVARKTSWSVNESTMESSEW